MEHISQMVMQCPGELKAGLCNILLIGLGKINGSSKLLWEVLCCSSEIYSLFH